MSSPPTIKLEKMDSDEEEVVYLEILKEEEDDEDEVDFGASTSQAPLAKRKRKLQEDGNYIPADEESCISACTEEQEMDQYFIVHIKCLNEMKLIKIERNSFNRQNILENICKAFSFPINCDRIKTNLGALLPAEFFLTTVKQFMNSASFYLEVEKGARSANGTIEAAPDELYNLLRSFDLECTYTALSECGFNFQRLRYISHDDLEKIFPEREHIGLKAELLGKIYQWKTHHFPDEINSSVPPRQSMPSEQSVIPRQSVTTVQSVTPGQTPKSWINSLQSPCDALKLKRSGMTANLKDILRGSSRGQSLLLYYQEKKKLDGQNRKKLVSIIIDSFYDAKMHKYIIPRTNEMEKLAEQIVAIFPTEAKDIYYVSRRDTGKANPSGMLFNRFNNINRQRTNYSLSNVDIPSAIEESTQLQPSSPEMVSMKNKLKHWNGNESEKMDMWKATYPYRSLLMKTANGFDEILEEWPLYKQENGCKYINHDFEMMFPGKENEMTNKWTQLQAKLDTVFKLEIKDKQYKKLLLDALADSVDKNSKDCIFSMLLNSVLKPTARFMTKIGGQRIVHKTSISDAISTMIVHLKSLNELQFSRARMEKIAKERKTTIPPFILVIGLELTLLKEFYVCYGSALQKFTSFVSALDMCFKMYHVFDIKYAVESALVWDFFQKYVYDIKTPHDNKSSMLSEFLKNLEN